MCWIVFLEFISLTMYLFLTRPTVGYHENARLFSFFFYSHVEIFFCFCIQICIFWLTYLFLCAFVWKAFDSCVSAASIPSCRIVHSGTALIWCVAVESVKSYKKKSLLFHNYMVKSYILWPFFSTSSQTDSILGWTSYVSPRLLVLQ